MKVGSKEGQTLDTVHNVVADCPAEAKAIEGGSTPTQLVDDDEGIFGGSLQDRPCLQLQYIQK